MEGKENLSFEIDKSYLNKQHKSWAQIPKAYWNVRAGLIEDKKVKDFFIKLSENLIAVVQKGTIISISGKHSTGKRSLAVLILKDALVMKGISGMYITAGELQDSVRQREETQEGILLFKRANDVDVLAIADFGSEYVNGKNYVIDVVNKRRSENKLTILISDKSLEKLQEEKYSRDNFNDILGSHISVVPNVLYLDHKKAEVESLLFGKGN